MFLSLSDDQTWVGGPRYLPSCHSDIHPNTLFKFGAKVSDGAENGYNFQFGLPMFKATPLFQKRGAVGWLVLD